MRNVLTFQQEEALRLYLFGYSRAESAQEMDIEHNTYCQHLAAALRKLDALPPHDSAIILRKLTGSL